MQPILEKLPRAGVEGFQVRRIQSDGFGCSWHFHPEYELTWTLDGYGLRMVGDHVGEIEPGDLVFVGANLPHHWQARAGGPEISAAVDAIVVHFREQLLAACLGGSAFHPLRDLLARSRLGLQVFGATGRRVGALLRRLTSAEGVKAVILLLGILDILAKSGECRTLCSPLFYPGFDENSPRRIDRICRFIGQNLDRRISRREAAALANLSESAFSRYFRVRTGKSFPAFVNELRLARACQLLAESRLPVTEIAFECGFQNLSNFNRQFLKFKRFSPREYRRRVCELVSPAAGNPDLLQHKSISTRYD